ncbi:MAG: aldo/keto reductase [candidate division SR1 bacterium]|nr:aldo/keto reductase [candidate division SR1 bacterium]
MTTQFYDNTKIPQLGLGTWQLTGEVGYQATKDALEIGYRHIDTAHIYGNHGEVGEAIKDSGLDRSELFITSKLWLDEMSEEDVKPALLRALKELQIDYIDLYIIHWPNQTVPVKSTLAALASLKKEGLTKHFGVSNFTINHLKNTLKITQEIDTNQVEFHPSLNQKELLEFCNLNKIKLTAYSPIGHGKDLDIPLIIEMAKEYNKTPAQICINWCLQKGLVTIPKASSRTRLQENFDAQLFTLSPQDIVLIDDLNLNNRYINPSFAEFEY